MYKYSFLVFYAGYNEFLKDIRKIGVVHLKETRNEPTPEMQELFRHLTEVSKAVKKLESIETEGGGEKPEFESGKAVFNRLKEIEKEMEKNHHQVQHLEKERKQLQPWGNFDWSVIEKLDDQGIEVRFMSCPSKKYNPDWEKEFYIRKISDADGYCYFVKFEKEEEEKDEFDEIAGADELMLPRRSLGEVNTEIKKLKNQEQEFRNELHRIAHFNIPQLQQYLDEVQQELSEQNAQLQTTDEVGGKVKMLEGWVPETKKEELDKYLEENEILYVVEKPGDEDRVPVLLKNNRFAKLYEIIGNLYELPNHRELDLVPFFAPFYMMFFGFSLGDAGYGLFIVLAAAIAKRKMPELKSVLSLAQWLGLGTVIFGALTGTFFGIDLLSADVPWLERFKEYMIDTNQMFNLAIILGGIQIVFGLVLKVINISRVQGFKYSLPTIGWLILIFGLGGVFGLKSMDAISAQVASLAQYVVLAIAGVLILLLNNPKRNIFMNFGVGLWDVYSMFTSLLGDILSYIRLFALGVSSAILGLVFNSMAMTMKPDNPVLGPLVMIIILVIGHSITIFMASLGAFVHPIRLTFVEFYKNAGFTGGGKAYKPFAGPSSKSEE
ncbi:MAG: V-type ATP synthase subunit I [Tangfeifania sp.]